MWSVYFIHNCTKCLLQIQHRQQYSIPSLINIYSFVYLYKNSPRIEICFEMETKKINKINDYLFLVYISQANLPTGVITIFYYAAALRETMKQNLFLCSYKVQHLKCKSPRSEMSRGKLDDFTSAEIWTILTRKMVVQLVRSKHPLM